MRENGRKREQMREWGEKGGHVQSGGVENECREVGSERATGRVRERRGGGERERDREIKKQTKENDHGNG